MQTRTLVLPLPEVETETNTWTKRNNSRLLRAVVTRATGQYRHAVAMLHLGRIRVYEINALDRARLTTADPNATASVLGLPEKVASMSTQGRGLKKRIVALLASCGVDMQVLFYAGAVGGSASYSVMGGAKHPIECVRI